MSTHTHPSRLGDSAVVITRAWDIEVVLWIDTDPTDDRTYVTGHLIWRYADSFETANDLGATALIWGF